MQYILHFEAIKNKLNCHKLGASENRHYVNKLTVHFCFSVTIRLISIITQMITFGIIFANIFLIKFFKGEKYEN